MTPLWPVDLVVMFLSIDQEVLGSIPGSAVEYVSSKELLHDVYGLGIFMVSLLSVHVLSLAIFVGGSCTLLSIDQGRPFKCVDLSICGP